MFNGMTLLPNVNLLIYYCKSNKNNLYRVGSNIGQIIKNGSRNKITVFYTSTLTIKRFIIIFSLHLSIEIEFTDVSF